MWSRSMDPPRRWRGRGTFVLVAGAVLLTLAPVARATAQAGSIGGTVVTAADQPLSDAMVRVVGTERSAATNANGEFRITGLSGTSVTLQVRRIGYRPVTQTASVGAMDIRITMTEQSVTLDEIVVTGTVGAQSRREIGNAITTIRTADATEAGTVNNLQQLLNARAPGVFVNPATGNVGTGARIRVRGASSLSLANEPLIYVDGVRINSAYATGPINQGFGSTSISRLNDINPDEIESIEVIKGPAAATLYGTEASNGVIQIITKRGAGTGEPRWTFSTRQGVNYMRDPEGRWPVNWQTIPEVGGPAGARDTVSIDIIELENARGTPVFTNGRITEYDLSTSGGNNLFRYFAAGGLEDTRGVEPTNGVERRTGRVNLDANPSERLSFALNAGYTNGNITLPCEAGCGGRTWTTMSANPANLYAADGTPTNPRRGMHSGLPEAYDAYYEFYQVVDRFTTGLQVNQQPTSWFRHRLSAGTDRTRQENSELGRRIEDPLFRTVLGVSGLGYRAMDWSSINNYTFDYSGSAVFELPNALRSTSTFGTQYYRNRFEITCASGSQFPAVGITTVNATTTARGTCHDIEEDATLGFFLQEQLGWENRLFVTAAIRADDNSAFGRNFNRVYYPKFSASWVVNEEPFWTVPFVEALKLRAAYGESGKQPVTFSALQTYQSATGPNNNPTVTPLSIGNPDLGPERSREIELGFDAGALNDRVGFEFTWYNKNTTDAILDRQVAPSIGIPGSQPFNAGRVKTWGIEALLRGRAVDLPSVQWDITFGYSNNDSEVLDLSTPEAILELRRQSTCAGYVPGTTNPATCPVDDFVLASAGSLPPRHQVGYPIGSYFNKRVVSAEFVGTSTVATNVMCDDGKGGSVACASAPFVFLGRTIPKVEGSLMNSVSFLRNFRAMALIDFKRDYLKVDGNTRARCVVFIRCRENFFPRDFDAVRIAGVQAGTDVLPDFYINDASFSKLREVSLSYTIPNLDRSKFRFSRAVISIAGRNLATWTDYPGLEPEAAFLGGSRGGNFAFFEQTTNPQLSQWVLTVHLDQ